MDFKFDLQLFAALDLTGSTFTCDAADVGKKTYYLDADGETLKSTHASTDIAYVTLNTAKAAAAAGAIDVASVTVYKAWGGGAALTVATGTKVACEEQAAAVNFTVGTDNIFDAKAFNYDGEYLTQATGLVGVASKTVKLKSASGSFAEPGVTFSNLTATLSGVADAITAFTSGTITTTSAFTATTAVSVYSVAIPAGAATYTASTDSNNNSKVTATLKGNGQAFDTTAATVPFNVIGNNTDETFTVGGTKNHTVSAGGGHDTIILGTTTGAVSISTGAGNDSIFADDNGSKIGSGSVFNLGDGNNVADLTLKSDGTAAGTAASGSEVSIVGGSGKDVINLADLTKSSVSGGAGADSIVSSDATNTLTGGADKDIFVISAKTNAANVADYKLGEDVFEVTAANDAGLVTYANALADPTATKLSYDGTAGMIASDGAANGAATITSSSGYFGVELKGTGAEKNVGLLWAGENAANINYTGVTKNVVMTGMTNDASDLLIGGDKDDTLYAGAGDSVYGGTGKDLITIKSGAAGVYVGMSATSGEDTVQGFNAGFDTNEADALYLVNGTINDLKFTGTGTGAVTVKGGKSTLVTNVTAGTDNSAHFIIKENNTDKKVYVINDNGTLAFDDNSEMADYFIGSGTVGSGIALTGYSGDIMVDLTNSAFRNIASVTGGDGNSTLIGGTGKETLTGGKGTTSIYGGAGSDLLVSGEGSTTFFQMNGGGKDTVSGFVAGTEDNSDVLNLSSVSTISRKDASNFTVKVTDADVLTVQQGANSGVDVGVKWASGDASGVAKIGITGQENGFTYASGITNYIGSSKNDVVSLAGGTTDNFEVWVDKTGGTFSSIEAYDMSGTTGDVLFAGKANTSETITGGQGSSSLWGGAGNTKDVLVGNGSGTTQFFYGLGEGSDVINGSSQDSVNLYNITVNDITKATINDNNVVFTTTGNTTVTVSGGVGTFKLADGSAWTANYSSKTWDPANN